MYLDIPTSEGTITIEADGFEISTQEIRADGNRIATLSGCTCCEGIWWTLESYDDNDDGTGFSDYRIRK